MPVSICRVFVCACVCVRLQMKQLQGHAAAALGHAAVAAAHLQANPIQHPKVEDLIAKAKADFALHLLEKDEL